MTGDVNKSSLLTKKRKNRVRRNPKQRRFRRRKPKKNQAAMPHKNVIAQNSVSKRTPNFGESFWNNYRRAMEWQSNSMQVYWKQRAHSLYWENQDLKKRLLQVSNVESNTNAKPSSAPAPSAFEVEDYDEEMAEFEGEEDEDRYEVSEEFMKFIEISLLHKASLKEQREKEKKAKKEEKKEDYQEESCDHGAEMLTAPEVDLAVKRSDEMKLLYGESSAKIHGMETAMHLGFMRKCDMNKPMLWPVMPLAQTFSSLTQ